MLQLAAKGGLLDAVDLIRNCRVLKKRYTSFASKYCSWHNPNAYAIYDSYVEECLWYYRKHDRFSDYGREEYDYRGFVRIVDDFKTHYGLGQFRYRQLDKFLWKWGGELKLSKTASQ